MIDQEHQKKFELIWSKGDYRRGSTAQRLTDTFLLYIPPKATINDYGSGTGRAEMEILQKRHDQKICMIDIAKNALEPPAKALVERGILKFIHADLTDLGEVPHADWGLCINVLMTVQKSKLDIILKQIANTCDNLFFEAYDLKDFRLGMDMTTVKLSKEEWNSLFLKYWNEVTFIQSKESNHRYIFVCKGKR